LEEIWRRRHEWHLIRLDEKTADDDEVPLLQRFARDRGLLFRQAFSHLCPYVDLRQPWETYLQGRSRQLRKNLRAGRRRLEALGRVTLRTFESIDEIAAGFAVVLQLHKRSWKLKERVEHGASPGYQNFYRGWLESQALHGRTRILALYCGDRPVAATIAFMNDSTYYSAQIVHDAQFSRCSPGTLLEVLELEGLMKEQRFTTYDFLGSFLNNKLRWTDTALSTTHVFVLQNCLRNVLIDGYYFRFKPYVKPRLLKLRDKLRKKG
jgi:CelD/BcsL family acetyltransferase involved in cellulose biosynthesis